MMSDNANKPQPAAASELQDIERPDTGPTELSSAEAGDAKGGFSFDIEQTLNIGSQSTGAGAGKVTFNP